VEAGQNLSNYHTQYMVYDFTNVVVEPGVRVTVDQNQPLIILGNDVTIKGTIDVSGKNGSGGGSIGMGSAAASRAGGGGGGGDVGIFATRDATIGITGRILAVGGNGGIGGSAGQATDTGGTGGQAVAGGGGGGSGGSIGGGGNGGAGGK